MLKSHWKLNENDANPNVADVGPLNHTGTASTNTNNIDAVGKLNGALVFLGTSSQYVNCNNGSDYNFGVSDPFSIVAWFKSTTSAGYMIAGRQNEAGALYRGYALKTMSASPYSAYFNITDANGVKAIQVVGTTNITDGNWHLVVATYSGSGTLAGLKVYVDGVDETTTQSNLGTIANIDAGVNFAIAARFNGASPSNFATGTIDDVRVYNHALSQNQVTELYNAGVGTELELSFSITTETISLSEVSEITANIPTSPWFNDNYKYRRAISISPDNIDSELTNFPILVKLSSSNFTFADALATGYDIRFTGADGVTELKYEREYHNSVSETAAYWVKIPTVNSTVTTILYVYYGNSSALDGSDLNNVWDSEFKAVYHLGESGNGTSQEYIDSTINGNHGRGGGGNPDQTPLQANAKIEKGQDLDGTLGAGLTQYIAVPNNSSLQITDYVTLEAWVYYEGKTTSYQGFARIIDKLENNASDPYASYVLGLDNDVDGSQKIQGAISTGIAGSFVTIYSTSALTKNTWVKVSFVYNKTDMRIYINAALSSTPVAETLTMGVSSYPLNIGCANSLGANNFWNGLLDEIRISSAARSAAWIKASYYSETDSLLTFYALEGFDVIEPETIILSEEYYINGQVGQTELDSITLSEEMTSLDYPHGAEIATLSETVELILYETYDLDNDFRTSLSVLSDVDNKINTALAVVSDYYNKFRMLASSLYDALNEFRNKKPVINDLTNNFRMLLPWQRSATLGIQSLGKTYIKVYINGLEQTDADVDSISINKSYNTSHDASFVLLRAYDTTVPTLEQTVLIKYNDWVLYNGYITAIKPGDNPDSITIQCKDAYWYNNRTFVEFNVGHLPKQYDLYKTYYNYISNALSALGANFGIGGFIPDASSISSEQSDAITNLVSMCGNYAWYYENGTSQLVTLGGGGIIDLDIQKLGENLNLYHVLSWSIDSSAEDIVNQFLVYTGGTSITKLTGGSKYSKLYSSSFKPGTPTEDFEKPCYPVWDADFDNTAWNSDTNIGFGYDYHKPEDNGKYVGIFTDYSFDARDERYSSKGYYYYDDIDESEIKPYLHIVLPQQGTGDVPSISLRELKARKTASQALLIEDSFGYQVDNLVDEDATEGYLFEGFDIDIKAYSVDTLIAPEIGTLYQPHRGTIKLSTPLYMIFNSNSNEPTYLSPSITAYYRAKRRIPEGQIPQETPENIEQLEDFTYIYNFYTDKVGSYPTTIRKNLYLNGYSIKNGYTKKNYDGSSTYVQGWNDLPYAFDVAYFELSKNQNIKYKAEVKVTLDTVCTYGITLSSRITMSGVSSVVFNVINMSYNLDDFTVSLTLESFDSYNRTVSVPYHGE